MKMVSSNFWRQLTIVLASTVLFLLASTPVTGESVQRRTLYVVPVSEAEGANNCSTLCSKVKKCECHPLSFYVQNVSEYFTNNTEMRFTGDTHHLELPSRYGPPVVNVSGVVNFSMVGLGPVGRNWSEGGAPQPTSIINCSHHIESDSSKPRTRNGILFHKSSEIRIENITIHRCGALFTVDKFRLVSALSFHESYNVYLSRVRTDTSLGFGLDADRIFGTFRVNDSAFVRSIAYKLEKYKNIGGNARFWYSKYNNSEIKDNVVLNISHCWFMYGLLNNYIHYRGFEFASGLIIRIYIPSVHVAIDNITVKNNKGAHGGNMAIHIMDHQENTSSISIKNSFIANGSAIRGGGLEFWVQVEKKYSNVPLYMNATKHYTLNITDCVFKSNLAGESGGGVYISHRASSSLDFITRHVSFKRCNFTYNSIHYRKDVTRSYSGAAVQIISHTIDDFVSHNTRQYSIDFSECNFENNELKDVTNEGGILALVSTKSVVITNCNFSFNVGTAISLRQSNIKLGGYNRFEGNQGNHGGALKFCEMSKMYLQYLHTRVDFVNNSANISGGAIYVSQQPCLETAPPCFFQPICYRCRSPEDVSARLNFYNNTAKIAGDAIYGGRVDHCYLVHYPGNYNNSLHTFISQIVFDLVFNLSGQRQSFSNISSPPYGACFYDDTDKPECRNKTYEGVVYPGQSFTLNVVAVGQRNGISPAKPEFFQLEQFEKSTQIEIFPNHSTNQNKRYSSLKCTIFSNQPMVVISLKIQQASPSELRYIHYHSNNLTVKLGACPWGFALTKTPPYKCVCETLLTVYNVSCDIDTQQVTRYGFYWLGCLSYKTNATDLQETDQDCRGVSLAIRCVLDYCKRDVVNTTLLTLDDQCSEGREGILCGRCKQNYTLSLGTSRCLPMSRCPDYMVYLVTLACVVGGILLVLFLIVCNFTISAGTINGLLFYAHIVHKNAYIFFPGATGTSNSNIFRLFVAWLNLDFGFEACFYRAMTQYHKVWLQFSFLSYIWALEFLIIILSRKYIFFTRLVGRNVVKVLATLGLLCFPKLFNTALSCLEFAYMNHSHGPTTTVWQLDGNIKYISGKHIPLFILGAVLCTLALLYTFALLFIQCLQKQPRFFCFKITTKWTDQLRPFFEAHIGPCHIHYRFWPGCLFFARIVLFALSSLVVDRGSASLYIIITTCVVIVIIAFILPNRVYKLWPLNVLELIFFVNLGVISSLLVIVNYQNKAFDESVKWAQYIVYPSVTITMLLFAMILTYHCAKQLQSHRCFRRLGLTAIADKLKWNRPNFLRERRRENSRSDDEDDEREPLLFEDMPPTVTFSSYRESLIED